MSIASEITRLQGVKSDILTAIADKGVTVPTGSMLDDCPDLIASISGGGGKQLVEFGDYYLLDWVSSSADSPIVTINLDEISDDENVEYCATVRLESFSGYSCSVFSSNQIGGNSSGFLVFNSKTSLLATNKNNDYNQYNITYNVGDIVDVTLKRNVATFNGQTFNNVPYSIESLKKVSILQCRSNYIKLYKFVLKNNDVILLNLYPAIHKRNGLIAFIDIDTNIVYSTSGAVGGFD